MAYGQFGTHIAHSICWELILPSLNLQLFHAAKASRPASMWFYLFPNRLSKLAFLLLRTGFEEDKNFHVVLNSVIAGRYHVTEYLGSAAFSKAIQAHDLHTGLDVCVKIIKNNKDFFDQSLDEIKLLKYVNKHDPGDKYHILRLYDYFYYRVSENVIQLSIIFLFKCVMNFYIGLLFGACLCTR